MKAVTSSKRAALWARVTDVISRFRDGRALLIGLGPLVVMLAAMAGDRYLAHGLAAAWRTAGPNGVVELARTFEHRVTFPNNERPMARVVQSWDFKLLGTPGKLPPLDTLLEGELRLPEKRWVFVETSGAAELLIDNSPVRAMIPAGTHSVRVAWRGDLNNARLAFKWSADGKHYDSIPSSAFRPTPRPTARRVVLWSSALVVSFLVALGLRAAVFAPAPERRRRALRLVFGTAIVVLGLGLRLHDYEVMPDFRDNDDELCATWNGWELLHNGKTRGWSLWPQVYTGSGRGKIEPQPYFHRNLQTVTPYFDHPPLLHLMVGSAATIGGAEHWIHSKLKHTRLVPICLAGASLVLMLLIGFRLWPNSPAPYLGALVYAVLPYSVIQTRVIKEEGLLIPLLLASILFFLRWRDSGRKNSDLVLGAVMAGLCVTAKLVGGICIVAYVGLVLSSGEWRKGALAGLIAFGTGSLLLVYAALIDWELFWAMTSRQGVIRFAPFNLFVRFFDAGYLNTNTIGRGWIIFLWIAFGTAIARMRGAIQLPLVLPTFLYLVAIAISAGNWIFGWYSLPLYPFLCMGAGFFLADLWRQPGLMRGAVFVALAVIYSFSYLVPVEWANQRAQWKPLRSMVTVSIILLIGPYILSEVFRSRAGRLVGRIATVLAIATFVTVSSHIVFHYDEVATTHKNFDTKSGDYP